MKFFAQTVAISSFVLLSFAAPTAEPGLVNGLVGAVGSVKGTVSNVVSAVSNPSSLPTVVADIPTGIMGAVYALLADSCSLDWKCTVNLSGSIKSLLVNGNDYIGQAQVSAWCDQGRCYGSADIPASATAPFTITCDTVTGSKACSATVYGSVNAIFANGHQLELWGWLTPTGYCKEGTCYASISALGDPMY